MSDTAILFVVPVGLVLLTLFVWWLFQLKEKAKVAAMSPERRTAYLAAKEESALRSAEAQARAQRDREWGPRNVALICPHCQTKSQVRTKSILQKSGISGGKATAAVLTSGVSLLATGLSRKEQVTQAHCDHCSSTWRF